MIYLDEYESPIGALTLASDGAFLNGLWLDGQKYFAAKLQERVTGVADVTGVAGAAGVAGVAGVAGAAGAADVTDDAPALSGEAARAASPVLQAARAWLDTYFEGRDPGALPPIKLHGTEFQEQVWAELARIPYGQLTTYGDIARAIGPLRPSGRASARAVGVAVGRNPLSIIVPCHRVVGSDGSLTGYAGGIARKTRLLELEGIDLTQLYVPTKGTAL